jgi:glucan 1,3-beta-glucosidase
LNEPNWKATKHQIKDYYEQAYRIVRQFCAEEVAVILSDSFVPLKWRDFMSGPDYKNVLLDLHLYQVFGADKYLSLDKHLDKARNDWSLLLTKLNRPAIVGEWSIGLDPAAFENMDSDQRLIAIGAYAEAQLESFDKTVAWFFWTYKTETMPEWDYKYCVENGLII